MEYVIGICVLVLIGFAVRAALESRRDAPAATHDAGWKREAAIRLDRFASAGKSAEEIRDLHSAMEFEFVTKSMMDIHAKCESYLCEEWGFSSIEARLLKYDLPIPRFTDTLPKSTRGLVEFDFANSGEWARLRPLLTEFAMRYRGGESRCVDGLKAIDHPFANRFASALHEFNTRPFANQTKQLPEELESTAIEIGFELRGVTNAWFFACTSKLREVMGEGALRPETERNKANVGHPAAVYLFLLLTDYYHRMKVPEKWGRDFADAVFISALGADALGGLVFHGRYMSAEEQVARYARFVHDVAVIVVRCTPSKDIDRVWRAAEVVRSQVPVLLAAGQVAVACCFDDEAEVSRIREQTPAGWELVPRKGW